MALTSDRKKQLLKDTGEVQSVSFPHVPQQRQGDNRAVRDVDDMFTLLPTLDEAENVTLSALPTYVSDNLYQTVYEGDFGIFRTMLEKLEAKLNLMESAICTVAKDVNAIRTSYSSAHWSQVCSHYCSGHLVRLSQYNVTQTKVKVNRPPASRSVARITNR